MFVDIVFHRIIIITKVVFCGRNSEAGTKIAMDNQCTFIKADVTKPEDVESFFAQIKSKFGRLDVLINNAGVVSNVGKQADIPLDEYKRIMDVNVNGAWYTLKYGVKLMEESGNGGRVVNLSSLAGLSGMASTAGCSHYGVSKHAIGGLTKIMALENAPLKIRINAIAPSPIETDLVRQFKASAADPAQAQAVLASTNPLVGPGDELPQVSDVTGVVAFLCGPEAKFINGVVLPIDGGYHCN